MKPIHAPQALQTFFSEHPRLALAFSGGTDSAYLLYAATACGCDVEAFYAQSAFQPEFERRDALRLAEQLGARMSIVPLDVLAIQAVRANPGDRPGMRALQERGVLSPLRLCGITKDQVREYSRRAGLFTWNKPAYACLATRVPAGTPIDADTLRRVEGAENALFDLGYTDFRVRVFHGAARLQLPADQLERIARERKAARDALKPYFEVVMLDLEERE